ncbi:hypothetical protein BCV69DRAFT_282486 [Microstroma glucosiphilum]|uniref:DUF2470 domain-containing protein n=1 Tax=Pseudomicrostroma glucosiphilum TaxID=1684307 RepID=A0A316UD56_9BASI|nr:hypothetical protein BCV69DRAFT_282486 [Pseudomicrostroma glucosiphilum]PWN20985.1 hypothetical protein BCV69DRAFT_282486 [Pseudomicrostroma glucosiphilum]
MNPLQPFSPPTQGTPSDFLPALNHMNADHQPSLRAIVQNHLSLPRPPQSAQLTTIDSKGFEVEYEMMESFWGAKRRSGVRIGWKGKGEEGEVRVQGGGKEVRERMVRLVKEAEAGRNKKYPILYSPPPDLPISLLLLTFLLYISKPSHTPTSLYNSPQALKILHEGIPFLLKYLGIAHVVEALGMLFWSLLRRGASPGVALLWAATTLPVGFPLFFRFKQLNPSAKLQDKGVKPKSQ